MTNRETRRARRPDTELTDAQLEAIVAAAIAAEASAARTEAAPPSSAIVWWRAQLRARREAAQLAGAPITIVHAAAIACGAGLALTLLGGVIAGLHGSVGWFADLYRAAASMVAAVASNDFGGPWISVSLTAVLISLVVISIAAAFVLRDE